MNFDFECKLEVDSALRELYKTENVPNSQVQTAKSFFTVAWW